MPTIEPKVAVLILGFNDGEHLDAAISSALAQTYPNYQVFYIDNASSNQSLELVQKHFPTITTFAHTTNLGYAGAYAQDLLTIFSQGFEAAVLLNPDVVVAKDWLAELVASAYTDPAIGFAQPKIFLFDDQQHRANTFGNAIHYLGFGFCGHYKMPDSPEFSTDRTITYASGASLLVKREAYLDIGGIDADYFSYLEDQDLVWRGHLRGWQSVLSAKSIMWHKYVFKNPTRSQWKFYMYERNRLFFILKNYSVKLIILILPMFICMEAGMLADAVHQGYFWDKIHAYRDAIRSLPATLAKRKSIQAGRVVSDKELFSLFSSQITFSELKNPLLDFANFFLKGYYHCIKWIL